MRVLVLAAVLTLPLIAVGSGVGSAVAQETANRVITTVADRACPANPRLVPARTPAPPKARRLAELPPASQILAVMREVDGCMEPVIVRQGIGR